MHFSWYDYILFGMMLTISTLVGVYFGFFGSKKSTANEYLLGDKTMKPFIITISLIASHISGTTLLGLPADAYRFGGTFLLSGISMIFVVIATIYIYLPVFYNLHITTLYEYLEMRFDNRTKKLVSFLYIMYSFLILPLIIYAASLAVSTATGLRMTIIVPLVCGTCIFYTSIGGFKAVIWSDTFLCIITQTSVLIVFILGIKSVGGFSEIWRRALDSERLDLFNFEFDATKRHSFWTIVIGVSFIWFNFGSTVIFYGFGVVLIKAICVSLGLVIYANYHGCDPFTTKKVASNDQLVPYFVMEVAKSAPGLAGVFIAGIMSSGLSGLSANLNCLAGTIYVDFLAQFFPNISEKNKCRILKVIVVVAGLVCLGMTFLVQFLGGIVPLTITFQAIANGPVLGIFTLGLCVPRAGAKAAFYGAIIGLVAISTIVVPARYYQSQGLIDDFPKPVSTNSCTNYNQTLVLPSDNSVPNEPFILFRISYFFYTLIGSVVTLVVGLLISYTTSDVATVDEKLITPLARFLLPKNRKAKLAKYQSVEAALKSLKNNNL
ncbi:Putative sodium-dependent multivitamin transporter-like Protein [Tribolium castaneum]|uniref:Sodium-dependent multivitamin transporter-like Protein n=1 Tax=Tribolium castaneum TaxID=7070 RepID=D6WEL3_TRICA|nr:Putative sodium-dependent multivitamin transporter-like Protein [Tribolium castaneum]